MLSTDKEATLGVLVAIWMSDSRSRPSGCRLHEVLPFYRAHFDFET